MRRWLLALGLTALSAASGLAADGSRAFVDLEDWIRRTDVRSGLAIEPLLGKPAVDGSGRTLGTIADVLFGPRGEALALIVRSAGGNGPAAYGWRRVQAAPDGGSVRIGGSGGPDRIPIPAKGDTRAPRPFLARELIGDRAQFNTSTTFGAIRDLVVSRNGMLQAMWIQIFHNPIRTGGTYPFPFYPYGPGVNFRPAAYFYPLPYNGPRVGRYVERYPQLARR